MINDRKHTEREHVSTCSKNLQKNMERNENLNKQQKKTQKSYKINTTVET